MLLRSTITLYGGGPGSGCNPDVGKCGRPEGSAAENYIKEYKPTFDKAQDMFKKAVGSLGDVQMRIKSPQSLEEKIGRKGYKDMSQVKDVVGLRVTVGSLKDLNEAVSRLKGQFTVTKEEDKVDNPTGFYRAYHLDGLVDGKPIEMQVRTQNQSRVAKWAHNTIYKGALKSSEVALNYASKVSDVVHRIDQGMKNVSLPDCPPALSSNCFSMSLPYV